MGRKKLLTDRRKVRERIESYFDELWDEEEKKWLKPPTLAGMCLAIGVHSRTTLKKYEDAGDDGDACAQGIAEAIKKGLMRIEQYHEERLSTHSKPTGSIVWLNNRGYVAQQKIEHSGEISQVTRTHLPPKQAPGGKIERPKAPGKPVKRA